MKFSKIELLKVPFSPDYMDVYDVRNNMTDGTTPSEVLRDFYRDKFNPLVVYEGNIKSVKITRGEAKITVYGECFDNEGYNYCLLTNDDQTGFFFIVGVDSENDGNNSTCTLHLSRDAWSSNIDQLQGTEDDSNDILRGHLSRFAISEDSKDLAPLFDNGAEINQNPATLADIEYKERIVWLAIRWDPAADFKVNSTDTTTKIAGVLQYQGGLPVTFWPVAILSEGHTTIQPVRGVFFNYLGDTRSELIQYGTDANPLNINDSRVAEAWLTYNAPIKASVYDADTVNVNSSSYLKAVQRTGEGIAYTSAMFACLTEADIESYHGETQSSSLQKTYYSRPEFPLYIEKDGVLYRQIMDETRNWKEKLVLDDFFSYYNDPKMYTYPYNYKKFSLSQKDYVCAPTGTRYITEFTVKNDTAAPLLSVKDKGKHVGYFSLPITSRAITSLDAYTNYLQTAAPAARQSLALQLLGAAFGLATSAITGNAVGAVGSIVGAGMTLGNYANNIAKIMDANSQNTIPAVNSQDDIETLDCPLIRNYSMVDEKEIDALLWSFHRYGYTSSRGESLRKNYRYWFDYRQTNGCALPIVKNPTDRSTLEGAYDRGLTRWHIDAYGTKKNYEYRADTELSANNNNPETELVVYTPTLFKLDAFWDFKVVGNQTSKISSLSEKEFVLENQGTDPSIYFESLTGKTFGELKTEEGVGLICMPSTSSTGGGFVTAGFTLNGMDSDFLAGEKTIAFRMKAASMRNKSVAQIIAPTSAGTASIGVGASNDSTTPYGAFARRYEGDNYARATTFDTDYSTDGEHFSFFGGAKNIVGRTVIITFGSASDPKFGRIYVDGVLKAEFNLEGGYGYLNLEGTTGIVRCFKSGRTGTNSQDWYSYTLSFFAMIRGAQGPEGVAKLNEILKDYI